MPISEFELSEQRNRDDSYHCWNGIMRNYVYENVLCRVATDFEIVQDSTCSTSRWCRQQI